MKWDLFVDILSKKNSIKILHRIGLIHTLKFIVVVKNIVTQNQTQHQKHFFLFKETENKSNLTVLLTIKLKRKTNLRAGKKSITFT